MKVYIDAGHGGSETGAVNGSRLEKNDTLRMSLKVGEYLKEKGVDVKYSRIDDTRLADNTTEDLNKRTNQANEWDADYFISIHRNSATPDAHGVENWIHSHADDASKVYGQHILNSVVDSSGFINRGLKQGYIGDSNVDFAVNRLTNMTSCLLELGFITNDKDNEIFDTKLNDIAKSIADAILEVGKASNVNGNNNEEENGNQSQMLYLPKTATSWRVYKPGVAPIIGNEYDFLYPSKFGGLSYEILGHPQPNLVTIKTRDYGIVNIWVAPDTGAVIK